MALITLLCGRCGSERQLASPAPPAGEALCCPICTWRASYSDWAASTDREVRSLIAFRFAGENRRRG